ncbi:hypothetical protein, partial [uncultured Parasutterella sp.]|uniref:hypothetical protein n=1 Tax=uncultured Parasutterella sp. TaxID=1263098 RepID=UPI002711E8D4
GVFGFVSYREISAESSARLSALKGDFTGYDLKKQSAVEVNFWYFTITAELFFSLISLFYSGFLSITGLNPEADQREHSRRNLYFY